MSNLFSTALSIFGDLLVPLVFLVICWCLHDLHTIELNQSTWVIELINRGKAILTQQVVSKWAHSD